MKEKGLRENLGERGVGSILFWVFSDLKKGEEALKKERRGEGLSVMLKEWLKKIWGAEENSSLKGRQVSVKGRGGNIVGTGDDVLTGAESSIGMRIGGK